MKYVIAIPLAALLLSSGCARLWQTPGPVLEANRQSIEGIRINQRNVNRAMAAQAEEQKALRDTVHDLRAALAMEKAEDAAAAAGHSGYIALNDVQRIQQATNDAKRADDASLAAKFDLMVAKYNEQMNQLRMLATSALLYGESDALTNEDLDQLAATGEAFVQAATQLYTEYQASRPAKEPNAADVFGDRLNEYLMGVAQSLDFDAIASQAQARGQEVNTAIREALQRLLGQLPQTITLPTAAAPPVELLDPNARPIQE